MVHIHLRFFLYFLLDKDFISNLVIPYQDPMHEVYQSQVHVNDSQRLLIGQIIKCQSHFYNIFLSSQLNIPANCNLQRNHIDIDREHCCNTIISFFITFPNNGLHLLVSVQTEIFHSLCTD